MSIDDTKTACVMRTVPYQFHETRQRSVGGSDPGRGGDIVTSERPGPPLVVITALWP